LATESLSAKDDDPGFNVILPEGKTDEDQYTGLAENVLRNFWTRVTISLKENLLSFHVYFDSSDISSFKHSQEYRSQLREGLFADIRFFPFRAGIFSGKNIDGRKAWRWVRENSGVGIIDHGFRVKPYGYEDDDWLLLSQSEAKSERYWRSSIMIEHFPIPDDIRKSEKRNPVLNLPKNHQLVGAVFIKNSSSSNFSNDSQGLIPSTDREGFRNNQAFRQVFDIVRGGIELMALQDKMEMERLDEEEAKKLAERAQKELDEAIREIEESQTLTAADKKRVITGYIQLREQIDQVDEYNRKSRQSLETMALLGVIAGFMTHESRRILENLRQLIDLLAKNLSKDPQAARLLLEIKKGYNEFSGHVSYASLFIRGIQSSLNSSFRVLPQVKLVVKTLEGFVEQKGISTLFDIQEDLEAPKVPIALYSGIVLNLYSNAVKAVMQGPSNNENPRIIIKSWNIPRQQILEIADNGIGIPRNLRSRIWDPLFTTTSRLNNPLGSGMGLGLSLVKKLLADIGGSISIVEPPPEYSTCFRVHIPRKPKEEDAGVD
jgi:signal transduction histidine kinase